MLNKGQFVLNNCESGDVKVKLMISIVLLLNCTLVTLYNRIDRRLMFKKWVCCQYCPPLVRNIFAHN